MFAELMAYFEKAGEPDDRQKPIRYWARQLSHSTTGSRKERPIQAHKPHTEVSVIGSRPGYPLARSVILFQCTNRCAGQSTSSSSIPGRY
jgi:hypothetical protein